MAVALCGDWSFISFSKGASTLSFAETVKPTFSGLSKIEEINFEDIEKGRLPPDPYPRGWDDLDWKVYDAISNPKDLSFPKAAEKLGVSWVTVKNHYQKILPQCKVMMCFFPEGSSNYAQLFITFRTEYEDGYAHCLKTLDRTSYIYKDGHRLLSVLFINRERYDNVTALFKELEEIGIIHDLCVSIPIKWWKPNKV